jgi:hypothetical protein
MHSPYEEAATWGSAIGYVTAHLIAKVKLAAPIFTEPHYS